MGTRLTDLQIKQKIKNNFEVDYGFSLIKEIPKSKEEYINLTCPLHGPFTKKLKDLLRGVRCNGCAKIIQSEKAKYSTTEIIERANKVHNNFYDYSKVIYKTISDKICIICPIHDEFWQSPHVHINNKSNCPECSKKLQGYSKSKFKNYCIKNNNRIRNFICNPLF